MTNSTQTIKIDAPTNFSVIEADKFRKDIYASIDSGIYNFVIDFKNCDFLDSTGLGVLIGVYKKCMEHNGSVELHRMNENVTKVFKLTRLDKIFKIV